MIPDSRDSRRRCRRWSSCTHINHHLISGLDGGANVWEFCVIEFQLQSPLTACTRRNRDWVWDWGWGMAVEMGFSQADLHMRSGPTFFFFLKGQSCPEPRVFWGSRDPGIRAYLSCQHLPPLGPFEGGLSVCQASQISVCRNPSSKLSSAPRSVRFSWD